MMRNYLFGLLLALLTGAISVSLQAQEMKSAYFLKGYYYRHLMNPAFMAERAYFSMPAFGNVDVSANGNVGLSNFLYPYDDPLGKSKLTTFMHRSVNEQDFLQSLRSRNKIAANVDMALFSCGFKGLGGFNTIGIGMHSRNNVSAPYELFEFMKSSELGTGDRQSFLIEDFQMNTSNYVDVSFNHARAITDNLSIGATLKVLVGIAHVNTRFRDMRISMNEQEWLIHANGYLHASSKSATFRNNEKGEIEKLVLGSPGVSGMGLGLDLGVNWQISEDFSLSGAITDLGFIGWFNTLEGASGNEPYSFKGFETIGVGSDSDYPTLDEQWDNLGTDLEEMIKIYDGGKIRKTTALGATANIGGEYILPAYRNLSFGMLSSVHVHPYFTWAEARASVNIAPVRWFEATVSGAWSTYGPGFGFIMNFHPKGFNFFVGSDFMITRVTPQFIPVNNLNANVCMGINFAWGNRM
ncbi:MAG: DUF5723 family protein [Bacteroidales bacterium]